jgi:hypothetical protein
MDALRADAGQRRQLARRVKQLSSADSSKLAQQLLKQENAVRDAAPARRDALRRERAQQREQARADVAARLRATLPAPPGPPRVDSARTPRAVIDAAHLARYRNAGGAAEETHKGLARALAADIKRML